MERPTRLARQIALLSIRQVSVWATIFFAVFLGPLCLSSLCDVDRRAFDRRPVDRPGEIPNTGGKHSERVSERCRSLRKRTRSCF